MHSRLWRHGHPGPEALLERKGSQSCDEETEARLSVFVSQGPLIPPWLSPGAVQTPFTDGVPPGAPSLLRAEVFAWGLARCRAACPLSLPPPPSGHLHFAHVPVIGEGWDRVSGTRFSVAPRQHPPLHPNGRSRSGGGPYVWGAGVRHSPRKRFSDTSRASAQFWRVSPDIASHSAGLRAVTSPGRCHTCF